MKTLHIAKLFGVLLVTFAMLDSHGDEIGCMKPKSDEWLGNGRSLSPDGVLTDLKSCEPIGNVNSPVNSQQIPCDDAGWKKARQQNLDYLGELYDKTGHEWGNKLYCDNEKNRLRTTTSEEGDENHVRLYLTLEPGEEFHHSGYHQNKEGKPTTSSQDKKTGDENGAVVCAKNTGPAGGSVCYDPRTKKDTILSQTAKILTTAEEIVKERQDMRDKRHERHQKSPVVNSKSNYDKDGKKKEAPMKDKKQVGDSSSKEGEIRELSTVDNNTEDNEPHEAQAIQEEEDQKLTIDIAPIYGAVVVLESIAKNGAAARIGNINQAAIKTAIESGDKWYKEQKAFVSALPNNHPQKAEALELIEEAYADFCKLKDEF